MQMTSPSVELAAKILSAYVTRNSVPAGTLPDLLSEVHRSITALDQPAEPQVRRPTEAQIKASIRPDTLISFEDGKPYKALRRHLTMRGLTPEAYKAKWGLPVDYPLVSAAYSARRSTISRQIGQDQRLRMQQAAE
ncbi:MULTISPECIES: MucR family transcriptional regulator [Methylobacterium]|jgi:predicted transcriptional regulator|uniref:Transcriptional regulator, MucR family n=1 Tax=Methylobacterium radiotolerans (strain ATCC 27329 / DSM 1819 / JCM 2831 / NBRC 15690 / NCIMB 10815 / 0-1) TaxID=426355 RepID=B1LSR2_METRJ|nr:MULTISPECIES: MucR family transcriptional regulator [Methylobacterium]GAN46710.1 MucR family transcriptional regulator [Methylobacterium sp. ME121]ACB25364.1 transcriptional regulator, MucR family [Methylobacterium radiotolerans JCM 2831]KTS09809.1 MucR family transcriptional regulator [Methylobacterium radiotolerans]KTS50200.1 MucR family transcriptional regulator [Methylobacterium radiotolerans]KZB98215.1 Transcriptional regulatory protein ros [Methylobacterium radiotolerans]